MRRFVLAAIVLSFLSAAAWSEIRAGRASTAVDLRYSFPLGDVLVYSRVFDTENRPNGASGLSYSIHEEWLIEAAVIDRSGGRVGLAIQATRNTLKITGRKVLEANVGADDAANFLAPYDKAETRSVRYLVVDELGRNINNSFSLQDTASFVVSSMESIFVLPNQPVWEGWSAVTSGEQPLEVVYEGLRPDGASVRQVFTGNHPSGKVLLAVDRDLGVPARFEYTAEYSAAGEARREHNFIVFQGLKKDAWKNWEKDPYVERALVLGAIAHTGFSCRTDIIRGFLDSSDEQKQNLAAAYCSLREVPEGLDIRSYLKARNPIVRFNAAKAVYRSGDSRPLIAEMKDSDPYIRRRAAAFFTRSTNAVPPDKLPVFWALQSWLYQGADLPEEYQGNEEALHDLLRFLKPPNEAVGGCYKEFLGDPGRDYEHPYYLSLPEDYDPAETYPMIVYLGMGDGRGDYAFQSVYNGLRAAGALSKFILLVPQAHGKWWDENVEVVVNRVLSAAQKTLSIDTNQVYLSGSSNGAMGTIYFGTRLPDRFAALAANMGYPVVDRHFLEQPQNLDILQNLAHEKVFLSHGVQDGQVTPEGDRMTAELLRKSNGQVVLRELPEKRHNIDIREVIAEILDVFRNESRNPYPRRIDFVLSDPAHPRCFWVEIEGSAASGAKIHADIVGNTIEIRAEGVSRLRLYLDENLLDLSKDVVAKVNGRETFRGMVHPSSADLLFSLKKTEDAQAAYSATIELGL